MISVKVEVKTQNTHGTNQTAQWPKIPSQRPDTIAEEDLDYE
jgi:hypothetical protein